MEIKIIVVLSAAIILSIEGYSPSIVHNTKAQNSHGEDICLYDKVQITPRMTVNQVGKCRELSCDENFDVTISKCFEDPYGKCHYDGVDYTLPFPDCCGFKLCT